MKEQTKPKISHFHRGSLCYDQKSPLRQGFSIAPDHCLCSLGLSLCQETGRSHEEEASHSSPRHTSQLQRHAPEKDC